VAKTLNSLNYSLLKYIISLISTLFKRMLLFHKGNALTNINWWTLLSSLTKYCIPALTEVAPAFNGTQDRVREKYTQGNYRSPHSQAQRATVYSQRKLQLHTDAAPSWFTAIHKKHSAIMRHLPDKKRAVRWVDILHPLEQISEIFIPWRYLHWLNDTSPLWSHLILCHQGPPLG